ncbi:MAG: hypothetical protein WEB59_05155 [Thermoanaerobaculia bacterium]
MIKREAQAAVDVNAHHRALRRCHGCGSYARPGGELHGRPLCEKCVEKARRLDENKDGLVILEV